MLKRFRQPLVATLVLVAMLCQGTWVLAGTTGGLSGTVLDENSAPVANALVTVASPSAVNHTTTDGAGKFGFLALIPDTYTLSIEKQGYEPYSQSGITVVADQNQSLNVATHHALATIARVFSRAPSSLIKPGTVTDVYSISPDQQDKIAAVGGGGNLNSAWSAIATVPGVFVTPGMAGYIGAGPAISIRGGDYDQIGYEVDGVPVNRAFDNYPSGPVSSLGQQELQVYTGVPPASAEANGLSGFINQVIRSGTYPGFSTLTVSAGGPTFYHKASFEIGGSTPNRNFSYYIGIGGYNQDFRAYDNFNGASLDSTYGAPVSSCAFVGAPTPALVPSCYTNGVYNGNTALSIPGSTLSNLGLTNLVPSYVLGPFNYTALTSVVDRDSVVNLHFGIPHKNGTKDDIQLLGMVNYLDNISYDSTNDLGGAAYANAVGLGAPTFIDGYQVNTPTGVALASPNADQGLAGPYSFPNVPAHAFSTVSTGLPALIPANERDGFENDQAIYKVQWTHNMSSSSLFRLYAYSYYSDWMETDPQGLYSDFVAFAAEDYELSSHTRGVSGSFIDQSNSQNLINLTGSYTTATTTRDNNTEAVNGLYPSSSVNTRTAFAVVVNANAPTSGVCYTSTGAATSCTPGVAAQYATLQQAYSGTVANVPAGATTCGGGPCEWYVVGNGQYATYNQVQPNFFSGSLTDEFHPNSKLTINAGLRFDDYQYVESNTSGGGARTLYYNAFNMDTCQDSLGNLYEKVQIGGTITSSCGSLTTPAGAALTSISVVNPSGTQTATFPTWEPRLGATYALDPFTVLRASYGRYGQGPNSAFVQYNALQADAPSLLYNTYAFNKFGFLSPDHAIMPEVSNNYDFSYEHQFRGDTSMKITPFWRSTQNQIQQFYLNQATGFVSGLNVGKQTSRGIEFELDKGNFAAQGTSARLTLAYTNSYINYTPLPNGLSVLSPLNAAIQGYNAYTKGCAAGGAYAGTSLCGTTATGAAASPCYTTTGAAAPTCPAGTVANPYYNGATQGLLSLNGNYPAFDILPSGIGSSVDAIGAPYVATLVINERMGKLAIAPIVQMFAGQRYGAPESTEGIAPDQCTATLTSAVAGDPRYPYGAPGGAPFNAQSCTALAGGIPDQFTGMFDGIGGLVQPAQLQLHLQLSYDVSKSVQLIANVTNIVNTCFGGTKVGFAVTNACGYTVDEAGTTGGIGNLYNPGNAIQPAVAGPYDPFFSQIPMQIYVSAKIKL
jgi:hypothetical protein